MQWIVYNKIVSAWEVGKSVAIQVVDLPSVQICDLPTKCDAVSTDNAAVDTPSSPAMCSASHQAQEETSHKTM